MTNSDDGAVLIAAAALVAKLTAEIDTLKARADAAFAAGMTAAAELVEGGFDRVAAYPYRNDGVPSKNDKCAHGYAMYEDCEQCAAIAIRSALEEKPE